MSDTLPCPLCDADIPVGSFPVFEGTLATCVACSLALVVSIDEDDASEHGGWASLKTEACEDCGSPADPTCKRCGGTGDEPAPLETK